MASSVPPMSQKDYLRKYLTPKSSDKKRKKKKKSVAVLKDKRSIIVDDDEVKTMRTLEDDELDLFQLAEDAPQIAGIIDERPDELRTLETFRSSARWRVVADEDGIEDVKIMALGQKVIPTLVQPSNDDDSHVDASPKRANKYSSDESPPRERKQEAGFNHSPQDKEQNLDGDYSPPRRKSKGNVKCDESPLRKKHTQNRNEDTSPPCKQKSVYDSSPSRRTNQDRSLHSRKKNQHSDSDASSPQKSKGRKSKFTSSKREDSDSDTLQYRNRKEDSFLNSRRKVSHSDSDTSPPRNRKGEPSSSNRRKVSHSDSDASPPRNRKGETSSRNKRKVSHSDSDASPPRNRKGEPSSSNRRKASHSDSDTSPPRNRKGESSSRNKRKVSHSDSDASPPRNRKGETSSRNKRKVSHSDADTSPSRHRKTQKSSERPEEIRRKPDLENRGNGDGLSVHEKRHRDGKLKRQNQKYDADITSPRRGREQGESPPRKQCKPTGDEMHKHRTKWQDGKHRSKTSHATTDGKSLKEDHRSKLSSKRQRAPRSDSDESSQGHRKESRSTGSSNMDKIRKTDKSLNAKTRTRNLSPNKNNSDESPPRRSKRQPESPKRKAKSSSFLSKDDVADESSPEQVISKHKLHHREHSKHGSKHTRPTQVVAAAQDLDESPSRDYNSASVGLPSDSRTVKARTSKSSAGKPSTRKVLGGQEAPIYRDRKTGRIRDLDEEAKEKEEENKKTNETLEKYTRWGKGLAQVAAAKERLQDALHEMSKPVARYADDDDLDQMLRAQDREGDPMLDYIRGKSVSCAVPSKPKYQGSWMPNRFNIPPGHRWDGVDRSNGYEKQWFEQINARKATEEEAHKWSISDM